MKRFVAILLALTCLISIVGCGNKNTDSKSKKSNGKSNSSNTGKLIGGIAAEAEYISSGEGKVAGQVSGSNAVILIIC